MKKFSILTTVTALGLAGSISFTSQAAGINDYIGKTVSDNCVVIDCQTTDTSEIEAAINQILDQMDCNNLIEYKVIAVPITCKPDETIPDYSNPGTEADQPEPDDGQPGTEVDQPETDDSEAGTETDQPETDDSEAGTETDNPVDSSQPEVDSSKPETDNNQPETDNDQVDTVESSYEEQVVALVNAERAKAGLNPVTLDESIAEAALIRAKETEVSFSHTRPDGRSFSTVFSDLGIQYRGAGENIAWGQATPEEVMNAWMNSSGHRANILNPNFTKIGVGYYQNASGRNYWTQLFAY